MDRYAVMGHPIGHSRSPFIHEWFARENAQSLRYEKIDVPPERFAEALRDFFATGGKGLSITVPHKETAAALVDRKTPRATLAEAVNTLYPDHTGQLVGDNTDGVGLVTDLTHNLHLSLAGRRVLMVGAGGAARGVVAPLLDTHPAELVIANRSMDRATKLVAAFTDRGPVFARTYADLGHRPYDLIINATSASLAGEVPPIPTACIGPETVCYDMAYGTGDTTFTTFSRAHHAAATYTGLGMLVEQAAEAFFLWRGLRPATATVRQALGTMDPDAAR
jgi:shikimate dehydrogenase